MLGLGYLDQGTGARVVDCAARDAVRIAGKDILSDHRPVTATLHWPTPSSEGNGGGGGGDTSGTEVADGAEDATTLRDARNALAQLWGCTRRNTPSPISGSSVVNKVHASSHPPASIISTVTLVARTAAIPIACSECAECSRRW